MQLMRRRKYGEVRALGCEREQRSVRVYAYSNV